MHAMIYNVKNISQWKNVCVKIHNMANTFTGNFQILDVNQVHLVSYDFILKQYTSKHMFKTQINVSHTIYNLCRQYKSDVVLISHNF